jgi:hypothetical protein
MSDAGAPTAEAWIARGRWMLFDHWLNQAESSFREALALKPDQPEALRHLGLTLIRLKRVDEGLALLDRAALAEPGSVVAWFDLAVAMRDADRPDAAAAAYAKAKALQPDLPPLAQAVAVFEQRTHPFKQNDYGYVAQRRYGGGRPPHPQLAALLGEGRGRYAAFIAEMQADMEAFAPVPRQGDYASADPFWLNTWFPPLDAMSVHTMLRLHNPARFIEIGSGMSTKFARRSVTMNGLRTRLTSIDPQPRNLIDRICDEVIRAPLERCGVELFDVLEPGDILFLDSSHRSFQGSDVTVFFLEILPRVKPGVIVQIHDILLPDDYLPGHLPRLWNEQYLLATALLFGGAKFEVLFPCWFASSDPETSATKDAALRRGPLADLSLHGMSFWMRRTEA